MQIQADLVGSLERESERDLPGLLTTTFVLAAHTNSPLAQITFVFGFLQGTVKRYKAYKPWAKDTASKPRPKDPLKPRKRRKAEVDAEQDLALQIRYITIPFPLQTPITKSTEEGLHNSNQHADRSQSKSGFLNCAGSATLRASTR